MKERQRQRERQETERETGTKRDNKLETRNREGGKERHGEKRETQMGDKIESGRGREISVMLTLPFNFEEKEP